MSQADELYMSLSEEEIATASVNPATEPHIIIDGNRNVTVPDQLKRIAVENDHDIETVTFDCPRYWDDHDMSKMIIRINYMRSDGYRDSYVAKNVRIDNDDASIMHFDWTVSKNVTPVKGTIAFLVCAVKTDSEGNEEKHWNSELCKDMYVSEGLECSEAVISEYPDLIAHMLLEFENFENILSNFDSTGVIVDQTYSPTSSRAQSGTAVAQAIKDVVLGDVDLYVDKDFEYIARCTTIDEVLNKVTDVTKLYMVYLNIKEAISGITVPYGYYIIRIESSKLTFAKPIPDGTVYTYDITSGTLTVVNTVESKDSAFVYFNRCVAISEVVSIVTYESKLYMGILDIEKISGIQVPEAYYIIKKNGSTLTFTTAIPNGKVYTYDITNGTLAVVNTVESKDSAFVYFGYRPSMSAVVSMVTDDSKLYIGMLENIGTISGITVPDEFYLIKKTGEFIKFTTAIPDGTVYTYDIENDTLTVQLPEQNFIIIKGLNTMDDLKSYVFKSNKVYLFSVGGAIPSTLGIPSGTYIGRYYVGGADFNISYLEFKSFIPDGTVYTYDITNGTLTKDVVLGDVDKDFEYINYCDNIDDVIYRVTDSSKLYMGILDLGTIDGITVPYEYYIIRKDDYKRTFTKAIPDGTVYTYDVQSDMLTVESNSGDFINISSIFHSVDEFLNYEFETGKTYSFCLVGDGFTAVGLDYGYYTGYRQGDDYEFIFSKHFSYGKVYSADLEAKTITVNPINLIDVDQTYNAESINPQSGKAVAEAISGITSTNSGHFISAGTFNTEDELRNYKFEQEKMYMFKFGGDLYNSLRPDVPQGWCHGTYYVTTPNINRGLYFSPIIPDGKEYMLCIPNMDPTSHVINEIYLRQKQTIADSGGYYKTNTVEGALDEIGATLNGLEELLASI